MKRATVALAGSLLLLLLGIAVPAFAQDEGTRPATTTFLGDTGLWFVPTAEVLPSGDVSASVHRTEVGFRQGNTNVSFWPVTGAVGLGRAELFGSIRVVTRIDRDTVPLLFTGTGDETGGLLNEYPGVHETWTGNRLGDLFLGAKLNLMSQQELRPVAFALRGTVKLPTGDRDAGTGTGEYDGMFDVVASGEFGGIELAGFSGVAMRGDPDDISISDGVRWGAGVGFPARRAVRATAEVHGEWLFDEAVTAPPGTIVGTDGSLSPATSRIKDEINAAVGLTWQHPSGMLLGAAINYRFGLETSADSGQPAYDTRAIGMQFRLGFHGGVKTFVPPAPPVAVVPPPAPQPAPPPEPAAAPPAPANRGPVVRARCEPCAIDVGGTATLRAEASDPDGNALTVIWSTTGGTIANTRAAITQWMAETAPGLVTMTVAVDDGRGARATDTVTIEVTVGDEGVEDVLFDFGSSQLNPAALRVLEPVIATLGERPEVDLEIEGHTCDIGSAEYNLALGKRRAVAVRNYLMQRGIAADRVTTISYGEERPDYDNAEIATRRLNRRAVIVLQATDADSSR
jgi:outer membrane protein OmpA-like peptidoglycan-associated protein